MRAVIKTLHRWLGLLLVLPMLAQGVTGALLVFAPMSRASDADQVAVSADDIVAIAREVAHEDLVAIRYVPPTVGEPAEVWFAPASAPRGRGTLGVRVNPVTMAPIWPPEEPVGLIEWSRRLHGNFLLPAYGGRSIVGWTGIGLVLLCAMGVPIWWPASGQWRSAITFSTAARGHGFHRRLHGAAGIWALLLLLTFGFTGAVLGFPRTVRDVLGIQADAQSRARPPASNAVAPTRKPDAPVRKFDAALALAVAAAPGTVPLMMFPPVGVDGSFRVLLAPRGAEGVSATTTVTVNAAATRVLTVQDPRAMAPAELALRQMRDLHFGQGFGVVWRCLAVVAGLALPVFAVTGTAMWLLRNRNRKRFGFTRRASRPAQELPVAAAPTGGLPAGELPTGDLAGPENTLMRRTR